MIALLKREIGFALGQPALLASAAVHAAVLSWFVLTWGDGAGVPNLLPLSFHEQLARIDTSLLLVLLPWTAVRCLPPERGNDLVLLSAVAGTSPSRLTAIRSAGVLSAGLLLVASGLPAITVAAAMDALGPGAVFQNAPELIALAVAAAGLATWSGHVVRSSVTAWALTSASLTVTVLLSHNLLSNLAATAAIGLTGLTVAVAYAGSTDGSLRSLQEEELG